MKKLNMHPLEQIRTERNLTRKRLGEAIGVGEATISRAEHGKSVSAEVRRLLCDYFNMTAYELGLLSENQVSDRPNILPSLPSPKEDIIRGKEVHQLEEQDMNKRRRQLLASGAAFLTTSYDIVDPSLLDRFSRILAAPYQVDERALRYVSARTHQYWQDRHEDVLAPHELLEYVAAHFQKITNMLEKSLLPSEREQLCTNAGETALLIGTLLFEIGAHMQARSYYQAAIQAAKEADFQELEAASWGWMSFTFTYQHEYPEALTSIQTARQVAARTSNLVVQCWLAAIEAEIQANLHEMQGCLRAISEAGSIQVVGENHWIAMTDFHQHKLVGYQGVCARLLYTPTQETAKTFLLQTQQALLASINQINPLLVREQAGLRIDLAGTYIQQDMIEAAYEQAKIAISLTEQAKSHVLVQRLSRLRTEMETWKDTTLVKNFDEQMRPFLLPQWYRERA